MEISFAIDSVPEPQGSVKAFIMEGRVDPRNPCTEDGKPIWVTKPRSILTSDNPDLKAFRRHISSEAHNALVRAKVPKPMAGKHVPVEVGIRFTFVKPPSVSAKRTQMVVRPDVDKLARATMDAMTGVLFEDDAQVVEISARKQYGPRERVEVRVRVLDPVATTLDLPLVEEF